MTKELWISAGITFIVVIAATVTYAKFIRPMVEK